MDTKSKAQKSADRTQSNHSQATSPAIQSPLLNREQAAAYLGISPKTIWTHTRRGLIPYVRLGGLVRYRRQALDETLAKLETRSTVRK